MKQDTGLGQNTKPESCLQVSLSAKQNVFDKDIEINMMVGFGRASAPARSINSSTLMMILLSS
ncbi:MAG: hypothetical protein ACI8RD_000118 [Bacillariaceae sp.]|jgi:hypothetical protein